MDYFIKGKGREKMLQREIMAYLILAENVPMSGLGFH